MKETQGGENGDMAFVSLVCSHTCGQQQEKEIKGWKEGQMRWIKRLSHE